MWATGRRLCDTCLVTLQLQRRHDLFWLLYSLVSPSPDVVMIEVGGWWEGRVTRHDIM